MKARVIEKSEEKVWDKFVSEHPFATIHQSSPWAHFQQQIPSRGKYWIIVVEDNNKIIGGTVLVKHKMAKGFSWLYSSRGPLFDYKSTKLNDLFRALLVPISKIAQEENAIFYRIDPPSLSSEKFPKLPGFKSTPHGFQPLHTLILDLTLSEADILNRMKPKGRYNIRLAEKKGVKIRISDPKEAKQFDKDIDAFYQILRETTSRDQFHGHPKEVYKNMLNILPGAALYIAEHEGDIIAANIITFYKNTSTYYYGASSNHKRNLMAPYLLQWQAIKDAKSKGFTKYDFLGIAPENAKNHPWAGVTEFKNKFGGESISYHQAREYAFKKLHYLAYLGYKKLR